MGKKLPVSNPILAGFFHFPFGRIKIKLNFVAL